MGLLARLLSVHLYIARTAQRYGLRYHTPYYSTPADQRIKPGLGSTGMHSAHPTGRLGRR